MKLSEESFEPCPDDAAPMGRSQAEEFLRQVPGWEISEDGRGISCTFRFETFRDAVDFVRWVGFVAGQEAHYPQVCFGTGYATIMFTTDKIGGLHRNDFIMAARVNDIANG
jgi:4a-hydroxytetrahydrobiopterin dehydratase